MTMPADSNWVPTLIWFVVMLRSSVMVDVRAALMFPLSIWRAKKARPRMGKRIVSTLLRISNCMEEASTGHVLELELLLLLVIPVL